MTAPPAFVTRTANGPRRMRIVATGLLVLMAGVFFAARSLEAVHPGWGFVRAFAEAAMVGGLADWFAVTALFRHPLGLPIPHTAIIPRNKDRIGDTLAAFLKDNFLIPGVVARRMRRVDVASAVGRFLATPPEGEGRIRETGTRLVADVMEALDPERLGGMIKDAIDRRMRAVDLAPILGQALQAAIAKDRHIPVLEGLIRWAARTLDANEHLIRQMIHDRAGSILRWTGLDETLADKIIDGLMRLLDDMAVDAGHPVRMRAEDGLARLAEDLQFDPVMRRRIAEIRDELLDNEAMRRWIDGLWEQGRAALLRAARDPRSAMGGKFGDALRQLGETLQQDPRLRVTINRFARRAAVGFSARYGASVVRLVSDTVRSWDTRTVTQRLEDAVGRDLQYIRVNGTLVGGLVGLAIHAIEVWLR
ncbi:DUF445 domain-containing protein [Sphingomonas sp.]|uniref:DUF445 domain-containing protein n=1 Tax=Sphingomonas sp. TaxID=28214 RepID=UPI002DB576C9|nr:DUF445 domain-containing protein [Sphingomonas sp.]HEU4968071.1 DUF445 domain-containing protein [Sphingomonas sp.]